MEVVTRIALMTNLLMTTGFDEDNPLFTPMHKRVVRKLYNIPDTVRKVPTTKDVRFYDCETRSFSNVIRLEGLEAVAHYIHLESQARLVLQTDQVFIQRRNGQFYFIRGKFDPIFIANSADKISVVGSNEFRPPRHPYDICV